jgi:hypothetical protein
MQIYRALMLGSAMVAALLLSGIENIFGQQQQQKGVPQQHQAPARPPVVRPPVVHPPGAQRPMGQPQAVRRPGQPGGRQGAGAQLARPGVVRGPAGALQQGIPANIRHNPAHVIGKAGARYNRQAFMFQRRGLFFRRHYYVGPGGAEFFYDDPVDESDPAREDADAVAALPVCYPDSDDCAGFPDPQVARPSMAGAACPEDSDDCQGAPPETGPAPVRQMEAPVPKQNQAGGAKKNKEATLKQNQDPPAIQLRKLGLLGEWSAECAENHQQIFVHDGNVFMRAVNKSSAGTPLMVTNVTQVDASTVRLTLGSSEGVNTYVTYMIGKASIQLVDLRDDRGVVEVENGLLKRNGSEQTSMIRCDAATR